MFRSVSLQKIFQKSPKVLKLNAEYISRNRLIKIPFGTGICPENINQGGIYNA